MKVNKVSIIDLTYADIEKINVQKIFYKKILFTYKKQVFNKC